MLRAIQTLIAKIHQCIQLGVGDQIYAAAIPAIPAIRAAKGNIFLTTETDDAVPAFSCFDFYGCFIDEFHNLNDTFVPAGCQEKLYP